MSPKIKIRPRRDEDLPALAAVLVAVHAVDGYPVEGVADPLTWLQIDGLIQAWVAELDGLTVGHIALGEPTSSDTAPKLVCDRIGASMDEIGVIERLFVSPLGRGHKLGGRLLATATGRCQQMGRVPTLDVMAKDRAAIHLYEANNWTALGKFHHRTLAGSVPAMAYGLFTDEGVGR